MQIQAVKLDQGWFIKDFLGFEKIKNDVIDIDVDLTVNQFQRLGYKEIKGIAIMERYFEKRQREFYETKSITGLQTDNESNLVFHQIDFQNQLGCNKRPSRKSDNVKIINQA